MTSSAYAIATAGLPTSAPQHRGSSAKEFDRFALTPQQTAIWQHWQANPHTLMWTQPLEITRQMPARAMINLATDALAAWDLLYFEIRRLPARDAYPQLAWVRANTLQIGVGQQPTYENCSAPFVYIDAHSLGDQTVLKIYVHHILADGVSLGILNAHVEECLALGTFTEATHLANRSAPLCEYVASLAMGIIGQSTPESRAYWNAVGEIRDSSPWLPAPQPLRAGSEYNVAMRYIKLPKRVKVAWLYTCWWLCLQQHFEVSALLLGYVVSGRPQGWGETLGNFARIMPIRLEAPSAVEWGQSLSEYANHIAGVFGQAATLSSTAPETPLSPGYKAIVNIELTSVSDLEAFQRGYEQNKYIGYRGELLLHVMGGDLLVLKYDRSVWPDELMARHEEGLRRMLLKRSDATLAELQQESLVPAAAVCQLAYDAGAQEAECVVVNGRPHLFVMDQYIAEFCKFALPPYMRRLCVHVVPQLPGFVVRCCVSIPCPLGDAAKSCQAPA